MSCAAMIRQMEAKLKRKLTKKELAMVRSSHGHAEGDHNHAHEHEQEEMLA